MGAQDELTQAVNDIKQSVGDMATRVDSVVNQLKAAAASPAPTSDTVSASDVHNAAAQLEQVAAQLKGIQATPTPAPVATTEPSPQGGSPVA